ncbi:hypothetical protein RND81_06G203900 [Saponaria officinalis]|uniref:Gamma-interferon-inducible lysosomal thiol reductase n=1 Tax=Saponaria officinalis TaxID=3572 RepID=A0AAW1KC87_SAPOF
MASSQHHHHYFLQICLLLHIIFVICSSSSCSNAQKVKLTLYYEALCPFCSYFIAHDLPNLFTDGLISVVDLRLVPWGNAAFDSSGSFQCQHGAGECLLNTVEACAVEAYPDPYKHYFLIQCIESLAYQQREAEWQNCFGQVSLDSQRIFDCYNQGVGRQLELQNAYKTNQLNPPHAYVPWVVVNNQPLREDYRNYVAYICNAYKGTPIPAVCSSSQVPINSFAGEMTDAPAQACSAGSPQNSTSFVTTEILEQSKQVFTKMSEHP